MPQGEAHELLDHLRQHGCTLAREGSRHSIFLNPATGAKAHREGILDRIFRQIEVADIVIADMTGKNPNVFYEVRYAHAKSKLTILPTADANDIPFDLKHRRHIV